MILMTQVDDLSRPFVAFDQTTSLTAGATLGIMASASLAVAVIGQALAQAGTQGHCRRAGFDRLRQRWAGDTRAQSGDPAWPGHAAAVADRVER
jgi:hypothetical protein